MSYDLFLEPEVHEVRRNLPGNVRQRLRRAIEDLATDPRPTNSDEMDSSELTLPPGAEIRRLRLDRWRVVYATHEADQWVWILRIYRRPPYNYEDLTDLVERLGQDRQPTRSEKAMRLTRFMMINSGLAPIHPGTLGAIAVEGRGSRVRFELNGVVATFHRPHPEKEAKPYQTRDARRFLEQAGIKP